MKVTKLENALELNLSVETFSKNQVNRLSKAKAERHRHEYHSILFFQEGTSTHEIDFVDHSCKSNQIIVIPKDAIYQAKDMDQVQAYAIHFKEDFFSPLQKQLLYGFLRYAVALRKLLISLSVDDAILMEYYFKLLLIEHKHINNQNQTFLLQNLMLSLLNKLEGFIQNLPAANSFINHRSPFQRFIMLVEDNYFKHKTLDFYTSELHITQRKLNDIVKKIIGKTAANFIIDRVLIEAKRELCFTEKSIKEVAYELGYDNQYYFSRIFKKRMNVSPEQFRTHYAE